MPAHHGSGEMLPIPVQLTHLTSRLALKTNRENMFLLLHSFDCSPLKARFEDTSKCHYGGKAFEVGEENDSPDLRASCTVGCNCNKREGFAKFTCTHIDCPEFFGGGPPSVPGQKCIRQYEAKGCCMKNQVCGETMKQLMLIELR